MTSKGRASSSDAYIAAYTVEVEGQRIYDVLVDICDAPDDLSTRSQWAHFWDKRKDAREFRFCGALGFGGKFWCSSGRWYVNCYREHETPERLAMIEKANARLALLQEEYGCD